MLCQYDRRSLIVALQFAVIMDIRVSQYIYKESRTAKYLTKYTGQLANRYLEQVSPPVEKPAISFSALENLT
jgi:hypothetical protein